VVEIDGRSLEDRVHAAGHGAYEVPRFAARGVDPPA
jgi:hypothetical protein